jgi:hypothetical protein
MSRLTGRTVAGNELGSTDPRLERIVNLQARILPRGAYRPKSIWGRLALVALSLWLSGVVVYLLVTGQYGEAVFAALCLIWTSPAALLVLTTRESVRRG